MQKNYKLAKAISEVSWAKFREYLAYKAIWRGRNLIIAPNNYMSSQLCSCCATKTKKSKTSIFVSGLVQRVTPTMTEM
nr:zinc ribbon domain-containing protein [Bacillus cereus]